MESRQPTHSMQPEQARPQPMRIVPEALEAIGRLAQEAFQNADRLHRSTSIKRGVAYARDQRAKRNNEGGH